MQQVTIQDVRAKYPQYSDLSDEQLADGLYQKYYADMPREDFNARIGLSSGDSALSAQGIMDQLDGNRGGQDQPVEVPAGGNAVSRALGGVAESLQGAASQRAFPGDLADFAARAPLMVAGGVAQLGSDLASKPVETVGKIAVDTASAPSRIVPPLREVGPNLAQGNVGAAGQNLVDSATAGLETATLVGAPLAGGVSSSLERQAVKSAIPKPRQKALSRLQEADPKLLENARDAQRLQAEGVPATTADLTSRNAQSRLKGAARRDGPAQDLAQDTLDPRQADQTSRLTETIENSFGVKDDFLATVNNIKETKAAASAPLYKEAYATPTKLSPELVELVKRPPLQKAMREAEELAAIDGVRLNAIGDGTLPVVKVRGQSGSTRLEGDTARLHYMRKALDDQIDAYRDSTTGKLSTAPRAQALVRLRRQFNEAVREANPAFKQADAIWSEGRAAEQAMERGLKAASMRTERQVRQLMDDAIRDGDQEFFELGFAQGLTEKIGKSGSDMSNQTLKLLSPENQKITKAVLGEERGEALLNRIRVENLMTRTRNRISPNVGSDTAENVQQTASQAVSMLADIASGNFVRAGAQALRVTGQKKLSERMIRTQQEVDEQLIRLATEDPEELMRLISEASMKRNNSRLQLPDISAPSAVGASTAITDQTARQQQLPPPQ